MYPYRSVIRDIEGDNDYHLTNRDQRDTTDRDNVEPPWRHHIDFDVRLVIVFELMTKNNIL